jgi:S1-C subfamily serine protease
VPSSGGTWVGSKYVPIYGGSSVPIQQSWRDEADIWLPFDDLMAIDVQRYPKLTEMYAGEPLKPWGVLLNYRSKPDEILRTSDLALAQKLSDAIVTLAVARDSKFLSLLGVRREGLGYSTDAKVREKLHWTESSGVVVSRVSIGGPGQRAGVLANDIILSAGGMAVSNTSDLGKAYWQSTDGKPSGVVDLQVWRAGKTLPLQMILPNPWFEIPEFGASAQPAAPKSFGVSARNTTPDELAGGMGVFVLSVDPGSLAERLGVRGGDFLLEVNGTAIANTETLQEVLAGDPVNTVKVWRGGRSVNLAGIGKF